MAGAPSYESWQHSSQQRSDTVATARVYGSPFSCPNPDSHMYTPHWPATVVSMSLSPDGDSSRVEDSGELSVPSLPMLLAEWETQDSWGSPEMLSPIGLNSNPVGTWPGGDQLETAWSEAAAAAPAIQEYAQDVTVASSPGPVVKYGEQFVL